MCCVKHCHNNLMIIKDNIILGKRIKEIRKSKGLTQDKLAEMVGIDSKHLSRIECGKNSLSLSLLLKICSTLQTEPGVLFDTSLNKDKNELINEIVKILNHSAEEKIRSFYKIIINM